MPDAITHIKKSIVFSIWNLLSILPNTVLKRSKHGLWYFLLALVDLGITGLIMYSLALRSRYLPRTIAACKSASTWQLSPSGTSMFRFRAHHQQCLVSSSQIAFVCDSKAVCQDHMRGWVLTIVVLYVFPLLAFSEAALTIR